MFDGEGGCKRGCYSQIARIITDDYVGLALRFRVSSALYRGSGATRYDELIRYHSGCVLSCSVTKLARHSKENGVNYPA